MPMDDGGDRDAVARLRFGVLGPLVASRDGADLNLGPVQQKVVLAALLVHANERVGREALIDAVWGDTAPAYAVNLLQKHVSALRRTLEPDRGPGTAPRTLTWTESGYRLAVAAGGLDADRFAELVRRGRAARAAGRPADAAAALHAALALWRGPAFDGLTGPLVDAARNRLAERRIGALEDRVDADLAAGRSGGSAAELVPELRRLVAEHPLRERLRGLLMLALYRSGRQAEALAAFREARLDLRAEVGADPGPALRRLHQRILAADPDLGDQPAAASWTPARLVRSATAGHAAAAPPPPARPVPAQLPRALPDFTGREAPLARLNALLDRATGANPTVPIAVVTGTAGVGKTSLAVHWAHGVRDRFPDGQLYVNLRGFDPGGAATDSAEVVRGFLAAFGVPAGRVPDTPESQAALYRSMLADRRVLVVLDNAWDTAQVQPLLPGGATCVVVVTSRNDLPGLVAANGAEPIAIDLLSGGEARRLLARRLGPVRAAAAASSVDDIIESCARLPLALSIAAARAATRPDFPLSVVAGELRQVRGRLDVFHGGDRATDIRAVFSWSYEALSPPATRLFRLLGLHPGADATVPAAASLAGEPLPAARRALGELARAHLVDERAPGRFAFHDLLRSYAAELADAHDAAADRDAAVRRLLDHYVHTAFRAQQRYNPHHDDPIELPPARPGVVVEDIASHERALAWFAAEHRNLLAGLSAARDRGLDEHTWQLAWAVSPFLEYQGRWHEWRAALVAARAGVMRAGEARAGGRRAPRALVERLLGRAHIRLDRYDEADLYLHQALALYTELGDLPGQGHTHRDLCWKLDCQGRHREALDQAERALRRFRAAGHRSGQARALNATGWFHIALGDYELALARCQEALDLQAEIDDRYGQAETLDSLGFLHRHLGHVSQTIACYERALELYRAFEDRYNEADTLAYLGDAHHAARDVAAARSAWREALAILERLGHPDAERLRDKLHGSGHAAGHGPGDPPPRPVPREQRSG
jgi:DNA-binding SARP family transcriptional activator